MGKWRNWIEAKLKSSAIHGTAGYNRGHTDGKAYLGTNPSNDGLATMYYLVDGGPDAYDRGFKAAIKDRAEPLVNKY